MSDTALGPFLALIAADAMEQIQHRIFLVFGVTGGRVNLHPAFYPDGLRVVIHALKLAAFDALARFVEALRRIRKGRFVVRLQLDWAAKSATAAAFGRIGASGIC